MDTAVGAPLSAGLLTNYFRNLVNQFYKILPMREKETPSLPKYIWRLESELVGFQGLVLEIREDAYYGSLVGTLHYLGDHVMDCSQEQVKQLVFEGIATCEKLRARYAGDGE